MQSKRSKWGFVIVGAVAALTLGVIGVAGAASSTTAAPTPSASAQAGETHVPDGDGEGGLRGGGRHGGFAGLGDIPVAIANLTGLDQAAIQQQRAAGTSYLAIAGAKGITEAQIIAEVTKLETADLDAAVKAGEISEAQRTQYLSALAASVKAELKSTQAMPAGGHGGDGHHGGFGGIGDIPEALATLTGTDEATIQQQRAAGTSYLEIAKAKGISEAQVIAEVTKLETAELDAAVKAGQITAAQRTQYLSALQASIKAELTNTQAMPAGGHGPDGDAGSGATPAPTTSSSTTQTTYQTY